MNEKKQHIYLNLILGFVLLQPFLDILSRLAIIDVIPNISTFIKPLFIFGITFILLFKYNPFKRKWIAYIILFLLFIICHNYLLYNLKVGSSLIIAETRFVINIAYMIAVCISLFTLIHYSKDKEATFKKIKYTVIVTFGIYFCLYLIAILTGTSALTYEYSDKTKLGYKGWYDSGQILGHSLSMFFPIILYYILKPNNHKIIRLLLLAFSIVCVSLLGTKVPYFITLIVLILYLIIIIVLKIIHKDFISSKYNILIVSISIIVMIATYQLTPVAFNTKINNKNAEATLEAYNLDSSSGKNHKVNYKKLLKKYPNANELKKYYNWHLAASDALYEQFVDGKIHPSDTRSKNLYYNFYKYKLSDMKYKLFGIGFLNQDSKTDSMVIERDFFMAFINFGIIGFVLFLSIPIYIFISTLIFLIKNIKRPDFELIMLFMSLGIFFCISIYAGYTYIYTNFSIFLSLLLALITLKKEILKEPVDENIKNITFLGLHLGYGGIESSTINSANALSNDYNVKIISFYKLKTSQIQNVNKNVKLEFLYDGESNKKEFIDAVKSFKLIKVFKEGIKSVNILLKKHFLVIKAIRKTKDGMLVSTRAEFNMLLSKYGNDSVLKVAQEHCYHNNDKKYIRKIANCYHRIDYLCALTTTLKKDYEKFLKYNVHTKVVLLPNMITNIPKEKSKLINKKFITVGRLDHGKRTDEIIVNFSKIKDQKCELYVIGDGKEYDSLKKLTSELKLNKRVHLLGYLNHNEIEKYMLDSSCFLMASVTEGLPMVLLEAMSYGVPCIAYETASGTGDIIDDNNGYLIKNRNSKKYVNAMEEIIKDSKKRKMFGENAAKKSLEFSKENVLKIWKKIILRKI